MKTFTFTKAQRLRSTELFPGHRLITRYPTPPVPKCTEDTENAQPSLTVLNDEVVRHHEQQRNK